MGIDPQALAILFHELRNPLTTLTTLAKLLQNRFPAETEQGWIGTSVERECQHLRHLLDQFEHQQQTSLTSLQQPLQPLEIISFVTDLQPIYSTLAASYGIDFSLLWPTFLETMKPEILTDSNPLLSSEVWINGDPLMLRQVLNNLIDNACKYTSPQGRVCLAVTVTEQEVILTIQDSGLGIPAAEIEKVFQPFYRVDLSQRPDQEKRDPQGQGLGLAISRNLVQHMGGSLTVESQVGEGSLFRVCLPRLGSYNKVS
ncbi:MAG: sensor histidine kinase [Synechococcaceae cyanobacterium RM1_1_27]|nr:sensor histidine kinase [Synechococcaceae cyanobacterium RM1_1_27]